MNYTQKYLFRTPGSGGELRRPLNCMAKQITVLIADDNAHMRESLRILISPLENLQIIAEAKNGEEAITLATKHQPDIILMDINMAPVNGFEATRKIIKLFPSIKIIGLSLHTEPAYCRNLMRLGAKGYVTKSSPYEEIIIAIQEVATGGKYVDRGVPGCI